jgi:hypothetical protein
MVPDNLVDELEQRASAETVKARGLTLTVKAREFLRLKLRQIIKAMFQIAFKIRRTAGAQTRQPR